MMWEASGALEASGYRVGAIITRHRRGGLTQTPLSCRLVMSVAHAVVVQDGPAITAQGSWALRYANGADRPTCRFELWDRKRPVRPPQPWEKLGVGRFRAIISSIISRYRSTTSRLGCPFSGSNSLSAGHHLRPRWTRQAVKSLLEIFRALATCPRRVADDPGSCAPPGRGNAFAGPPHDRPLPTGRQLVSAAMENFPPIATCCAPGANCEGWPCRDHTCAHTALTARLPHHPQVSGHTIVTQMPRGASDLSEWSCSAAGFSGVQNLGVASKRNDRDKSALRSALAIFVGPYRPSEDDRWRGPIFKPMLEKLPCAG